jgi:predicted amidophosphoribosyltransferase
MAMTTCRECAKEISDTAKSCPHCGAKVPRTKWWLWIPLGLVVAFLAYGAILSNTPKGKEKAKARDAIALCWQEHERKSLDANTQRFVASTCEMMEQQFRDKYGVNP